MPVGTVSPEKLVREQMQVIAGFFGAEISPPSDRLWEVVERNREISLLQNPKILFVPRHSFPKGITFPGQQVPMSPYLYRYMEEGLVDADAASLPGVWMIFDSTPRPDFAIGRQMYLDTPRFREVLAGLREAQNIKVLDSFKDVRPDSRFVLSADEVDGGGNSVANEIANILKLQPGEEATSPPYAVFYYVSNSDLGLDLFKNHTAEWLRDKVKGSRRLYGGDHATGGLSHVASRPSNERFINVGFRLQITFPPQSLRT